MNYQQRQEVIKLVDFGKVYDILVKEAGAVEGERDSFLDYHPPNNPPSEWRFRGRLGFGGKFRCDVNEDIPIFVTYYREDNTIIRDSIRQKVNLVLEALWLETSLIRRQDT